MCLFFIITSSVCVFGVSLFWGEKFVQFFTGKENEVYAIAASGFLLTRLAILPVFLGVTGVWLAIPMAEVLTFGVAVLLTVRRRLNRYAENDETVW